MNVNIILKLLLGVTVFFASLTVADQAYARIIAFEGFRTTFEGTANYYDGVSLGHRRAVAADTIGFLYHPSDPKFHWIGSSRLFLTRKDASLSHEGVPSVNTGALVITTGNWAGQRRYSRQITVDIPTASTYYLSALINMPTVAPIPHASVAFRSVGFGHFEGSETDTPSPNRHLNVEMGMHLGVENVRGETFLSAFTGAQSFNIAKLDSSMAGQTFQIVIKLIVNAVGDDYLTAWYAPQGANQLNPVSAINNLNVGNVWSSPQDLRFFMINSQGLFNPITIVDEVYFGTTLGSVTQLTLAAGQAE